MTDTRAVYLEPNKITLDSMPLPELQPNQVLVQTHQASICGSERYFYRGITVRPQDEARGGPETQLGDHGEGSYTYPMGPLGHEGGGTIVDKGSAVDEYVGGGKVASIVVPGKGANIDPPVTATVAGRYGHHFEAAAATAGQQITMLGQQPNDTDAHRAKTGNTNLQRVGHDCLIAAPSHDGWRRKLF